MQQETHKQFCHTNSNQPVESTNLLCEKCNNLQELKLKELNNFDTKNEDNFDEEYKIFKSKLDHIYDLCKQCKLKLNYHLQKQDQQIGTYLSKEKQKQSLAIKSKLLKQTNQSTPVQQQVKKAYTVAGDMITKSPPNLSYNRIKPKEKKYIYEPEQPTSPSKMVSTNEYEQQMNKLISTTKLLTKKSTKITFFLLQTILIDFLTYLSIILIFLSDLVNLINDSGVWSSENGSDLDDSYLFRNFLRLYKYAQLILVLIILVSIYSAVKRPKVSRMLIIIGFCFNLLIHMNFFQIKFEEKYILEVFMSFFLSAYLTMARCYNVLQCVRYIKSE